jgi:CBS domain-containing protein
LKFTLLLNNILFQNDVMSREDFDNSSILVKDIMTKVIISVNTNTTVFQVAKMMEQSGIGAILIKKDNHLSGIITDRDYATKIVSHNLSSDTSVETVMSSPLVTINFDESISAAAERMTNKKIRKLAVTNNGKIVGLITSTDLVTQLSK